MQLQGILDENFDAMKGDENPNVICEMIHTFCRDASDFIEELTDLLYLIYFFQFYHPSNSCDIFIFVA